MELKVGDIVRYECKGGSGIREMNGQIARIEKIDEGDWEFRLYWIRFPWPYFVTMSATVEQLTPAGWEK